MIEPQDRSSKPSTTARPALDGAIECIRRGLAIIPVWGVTTEGACCCPDRATCRSSGKHPKHIGWKTEATNDFETIVAWYRSDQSTNFGIAYGASGCVGLDVDAAYGGFESFKTLETELGAINTLRVVTGGGGEHHILRVPDGVTLTNEEFGDDYPGINVRGTGGMTVAPGSLHKSGRRYAFDAGSDDITPIPSEWILKLNSAKLRNGKVHGEYVAPTKIPAGSRHDAYKKLAGFMRRKGCDIETIFAALVAFDQEKCEPPKGDNNELRKMAEDFCRSYAPTDNVFSSNGHGSASERFRFAGTDHDNALLFAEKARGKLLFCADFDDGKRGGWMVYDGLRWTADKSHHVMQFARRVANDMEELAATIPDVKERARAYAIAMRTHNKSKLEAMISLARGALPVRATQFDLDPDVLNCLNGTVRLKTGTVRPNSPDDLISKLAHVKYDPEATAPRFLAFLREVLLKEKVGADGMASGKYEADEDLISWVQKFIGYGATGRAREHRMGIFYGGDSSRNGSNGKGTLIAAVQAALGDYAVTVPTKILLESERDVGSATPELVDLVGAHLAVANEMPSGSKLDENTVKQLVSTDKQPCRQLFCPQFQFKPSHTLIVTTNNLPEISGTDEAIWGRLGLVPFYAYFERGTDKCETDLDERLAKEASGILNWIVVGAKEWYKHKLGSTKAVKDAVDEYRADQDVLAPFILERCVKDSSLRVLRRELFGAYRAYCEASGLTPLGSRKFHKLVIAKFICRKMDGLDAYRGIALKPRRGGDTANQTTELSDDGDDR